MKHPTPIDGLGKIQQPVQFLCQLLDEISHFCNMKLRNLSKMYKRDFCILFKQCEIPLIHLKYVLTNNLLSLTY